MDAKRVKALVAASALAQLRVAVDQKVQLTSEAAEAIALAIAGGAAQSIANIEALAELEAEELEAASKAQRRPGPPGSVARYRDR
jgi:hypothetical protein